VVILAEGSNLTVSAFVVFAKRRCLMRNRTKGWSLRNFGGLLAGTAAMTASDPDLNSARAAAETKTIRPAVFPACWAPFHLAEPFLREEAS
jgi:hypothetical protein